MTDILKKRALEVSDALWDIAKKNPSVERQLFECAKVLAVATTYKEKRIYFIDENRSWGHSRHLVRATSEEEALALCGLHPEEEDIIRSFEEQDELPMNRHPTFIVELSTEGDSTIFLSDEESPDSVPDHD